MLKVELDATDGVITVEPTGTLAAEDFAQISELADPYIEEHGALAGLVIHTQEFPGWDSFGALIQHVRFVREHHERLEKVALVTDSMLGDFAETIAGHFVSADVKHFDFDDLESAREWVRS